MSTQPLQVEEKLSGSAPALAALYEIHAPAAGRLAYLLTGDPHLAEDLAQEAFTRLIGRLGGIRDEAAVGQYLRRTVVNLARKHWRRRRTEQAYLTREHGRLHASIPTAAIPGSRDEVLWSALIGLPYRQRAALVLRFYEDLSEQQVARVLGCPVGTVKSSVARALTRM